ncbi:hypothetical protein PLICRDRAFT_354477 [Plicaturopsis crispa FD-325 SS-3]|uniref:Uncharacterized protein n=1 Tax=Plicaturopsis crispa FD-325 SS-3 TaxID=944288 RepID=A0A0C9SXU2_PLICR|nr:hypothetical protein PLICRDRAFT_354477 [Plicaturopsis crispa FD-325 SS-3]
MKHEWPCHTARSCPVRSTSGVSRRKYTSRFAENWPAGGRGTSPCASRYEHPAQCPGHCAPSPDSRLKMYFPLRGNLASGWARYEPVRVSLKHGACVWYDRVHPRVSLCISPSRSSANFVILAENVLSASWKIGQRAGEARARARLATNTQHSVQGTARRPLLTRFWPAGGRGTRIAEARALCLV